MKPAELYSASPRPYQGLPELFFDRDVPVAACGRLCMHRKMVDISIVLAGQSLGVKEAIWLVSFMHYDLGYDLEQKPMQTLDNPFGPRLSPIS